MRVHQSSLGDVKKTLEDAAETADYKSPPIVSTHVETMLQNHLIF